MTSKSKGGLKVRVSPGKLRHGGYSYLTTGELPADKKYVEKYLTRLRQKYIENIGPREEDLTAGQAVLLNKLITMEGLCRCIEIEAARAGTLNLRHKYPTYVNMIIKVCSLLGIEKKEFVGDITPAEQAEIIKSELKNADK
jgi:hypothetical protein